ncbi:hypothetical protein JCM15831A_28370 [Asaia astilbis]
MWNGPFPLYGEEPEPPETSGNDILSYGDARRAQAGSVKKRPIAARAAEASRPNAMRAPI